MADFMNDMRLVDTESTADKVLLQFDYNSF